MRAFAQHPSLEDVLTVRHVEMRHDGGGGLLRVVPSDGPRVHGLSSTLYIGDEVWAWPANGEPAGAWQQCVGDPEFTAGEDIWIGVDVGGERSATAVVYVNQQLHVGVGIYHGDPGVLEAVDHVRALAGQYNVRELVYDPWRFGQAAQELERERFLVVAFPQHDARMIPASARLHAAIVEQRLTLPDDPEFARHATDAVARHNRRGWRIDKPSPRANMDASIALAMAVERAEQKPAPVERLGWL